MERIASLDLLRGIAAFSVAIPHFLLFSNTFAEGCEIVSILAVEVFFTLSGFVLAPQILNCMSSQRAGDLGTFLVRRWMRTVPPFLVALMAMSILTGHFLSADFWRYAFYVQNLFSQHNGSDFFPVAWSLSIEEWFYVTFPVVAICSYRLFGGRSGKVEIAAAIGFIVLITAARTVLGDDAQWGAEVRRVVVFRVDLIAYGFLLYVLLGRVQFLREGTTLVRIAGAGIALLIAAATAYYTAAVIGAGGARLAQHLFSFFAAALGCSSIFFFYTLAPLLARSARLVVASEFLGKISYSAYLFHIILAQALFAHFAHYSVGLQVSVFLALLLPVCAAFYYYFERPILAARPRYGRTAPGTTIIIPKYSHQR